MGWRVVRKRSHVCWYMVVTGCMRQQSGSSPGGAWLCVKVWVCQASSESQFQTLKEKMERGSNLLGLGGIFLDTPPPLRDGNRASLIHTKEFHSKSTFISPILFLSPAKLA